MIFRLVLSAVGAYSVFNGVRLAATADCPNVGISFPIGDPLTTCYSAVTQTPPGIFQMSTPAAYGVLVLLGLILVATSLRTVVRGLRVYIQANRVVGTHAVRLSQITGISSRRIQRDIVQQQITPGDWADAHGLDPITFERRRLDG